MISVTAGPFAGIKPFMAWNRLEGRPRKKDFESVLKAKIHDPLWMLGRQWQMGEFKGNDTGSGILARVQMDYARISQQATLNGSPSTYSGKLPLEPLVERITHRWSVKERILMGKKWLNFLKTPGFSWSHYLPIFDNDSAFLFTIDKEPATASDPEDLILNKGVLHSDPSLFSFYAASSLSGRLLDGAKIFEQIVNETLMPELDIAYETFYGPGTSITITMPADLPNFETANNDFKKWVVKMYSLPDDGILNECWNPRSMDYQFDIYVPDNDGLNERRLSAQQYSKGNLDWYAFTQNEDEISEPSTKKVKALQLIMSANRFAGMPSTRWWEFENGAVNFANLDADTTDIAKIIMTQFALVYQDDWFNIPYNVPVSSAARIQGILVTDVFGVKTFVANSNVEKYNEKDKVFVKTTEAWKKWNWMDISQSSEYIGEKETIDRMLILPVVNKTMESKPFESILFMRDEMANLVWGVEKIVPNYLGKGKDAYESVRDYNTYLQSIKPHIEPETTIVESAATTKLEYQLASQNIPENWIPFMPVHTGNNNRSIQLQRASMPRILKPYATSLVRPVTNFLRKGLDNSPVQPFFLNEEEVTRAGTIVETTYQRARWYNGATVSWVGRRKITGRGEGSSGLTFDNLT